MFESVKREHCKSCGNPWWFDKSDRFTCTMCGDFLMKEIPVSNGPQAPKAS